MGEGVWNDTGGAERTELACPIRQMEPVLFERVPMRNTSVVYGIHLQGL